MVWAFKRGMLELGTIYTSKDIGCFMYWYINAFSLKFVIFKPPCETKTCIELKKTKFWHHIMAKGTYSSPKFLSQMKKVVNRPTLINISNYSFFSLIFCNIIQYINPMENTFYWGNEYRIKNLKRLSHQTITLYDDI